MKFLLLLFSSVMFSQQLSFHDVDEFTKDTIIQVNASKKPTFSTSDNVAKGLFNNVFISSRLNRNNTNYKTLQISASFGFTTCFSNYEGKCIILFENKETVTLKQISRVDCGMQHLVKYSLTDDFIQKLAINKISKIRMYGTEGYIEFEIKDNKKDIIKEHFKLFQKEITQ